MKTYSLLKIFVFFGLASFLISCGDDDTTVVPGPEEITLGLSRDSYTFGPDESDTIHVTVLTNPDRWTIDDLDEKPLWADIMTDGDIIIIGAEDNDGDERSYKIVVRAEDKTAEFTIFQRETLPHTAEFRLYEIEGLPVRGISSNGLYTVGTFSAESFRYNVETEEVVHFPMSEQIVAVNVSDDGTIVGSVDMQPAYYRDGAWTELPLDPLVSGPVDLSDARARVVSADGRVMAGDIMYRQNNRMFQAMIWVDGVPALLDMPEWDAHTKPVGYGYHTTDINDDGTKILGKQITQMGSEMAVYWTDAAKFYDFGWDAGLHRYDELVIDDISYGELLMELTAPISMSRSGRYMLGEKRIMNPSTLSFDNSIYVYDFETGAGRAYDPYTELGIDADKTVGCQIITDRGTVFFGTPRVLPDTSYILIDGEPVLFKEWLEKTYSLSNLPEGMVICGVSADGKTITGFIQAPGAYENFVVRLSHGI